MTDSTLPAAAAPPFDAVLYPNRSLGARGFAVLMTAIVAVSMAVGGAFALAGAWPVTGFLGLDVLLLYLAFRWNYREARRAEFIRLDRNGLTIRRLAANGTSREWRFEPAWVQVIMDDPPTPASQLTLRSHGNSLVIGGFLTPDERLELASALRQALRANPTSGSGDEAGARENG
jgi:uncharacterized membrane protein